jgi:hypothetical protein
MILVAQQSGKPTISASILHVSLYNEIPELRTLNMPQDCSFLLPYYSLLGFCHVDDGASCQLISFMLCSRRQLL